MKAQLISQPQFFIIGSQRSGTTLLRLLLNSHTKVAIPTEATFLMPYLNRRYLKSATLNKDDKKALYYYLKQNSQFVKWGLSEDILQKIIFNNFCMQQIIAQLYLAFANKYSKPICGDKSPTFIRKLNSIARAFPLSKFIYIVRDGRDTFLSLRSKTASGSENVALSAVEWAFKQRLIEKHLLHIKNRFYKLRYEDLLANTENELISICRFLNIDYQVRMLDFWKNSDDFIAKHHSELIFRPIDLSNRFKWKQRMSPQENAIYYFFGGKYLRANGYEIPKTRVHLLSLSTCLYEMAIYLPRRLLRIFRIAFVMRFASKTGKRVGDEYYN